MNFLSINFCTELGSIFVKTRDNTFNKDLQIDKTNNDFIMKEILIFFEKNDLSFNDIEKIFINQGPGNFSGLRSSLAIAKGISLSKNLDLYGYNTFLWSCAKFFNKHDPIYSFVKFKKKCFVKKFDKYLKSNSKPKEIKESEIINKYDNKLKVIPKSIISTFDKKVLKLNNLNIVNLDHNELEFLQLKDLLDKDLIKPLYLS